MAHKQPIEVSWQVFKDYLNRTDLPEPDPANPLKSSAWGVPLAQHWLYYDGWNFGFVCDMAGANIFRTCGENSTINTHCIDPVTRSRTHPENVWLTPTGFQTYSSLAGKVIPFFFAAASWSDYERNPKSVFEQLRRKSLTGGKIVLAQFWGCFTPATLFQR